MVYAVILMWAFGFSSSAVYGEPSPGLSKKFERVLAKGEKWSGAFGVAVMSLKSGDILVSKNSDQQFNLASNGKIISTAAALRKFGGKHRFETRIFGVMNDKGVVEGDLFIVGGGDPKLMESDLKSIAQSLSNLGLKQVKGGVVVDDFLLDQAFLPPAFEQKNTDAAYRSSAGALGVNYNAVAVSFRPGNQVGTSPIVRVSPVSGYPLIDNKSNTKKGKSEALTITTRGANTRTRVTVDGTIGVRSKGGAVRRRIDDPGIFAGYLFAAKLKESGITISEASVKRGQRPKASTQLLSYASDPLEHLARDTNEHSNNMMAETLFKMLASGNQEAPGTWEGAREVAGEMLTEAGIEKGSYKLLNGSGLYEADFMTPLQMVQFLAWAKKQTEWGEMWVSTLPVGGKTGTLRGRLKKKSVIGKVKAKTGTLNNVVTLSGYVESKTRGLLAFSFLFNEVKKGKPNLRAIRRIQDELCGILADL